MKISPKNHTTNGVEIEILIEIDLKIRKRRQFRHDWVQSDIGLCYETKSFFGVHVF